MALTRNSTCRMTIIIDRQRVFARHGVLPQEQAVGAYFYVSLEVEVSDCAAMQSDELGDTVSYARLAALVNQEMEKSSKLLENVAWRISNAILSESKTIIRVKTRVVKENPPMGIECMGAGIELTLQR